MVLYSKINLQSKFRSSFLVSLICIISISFISCKSYAFDGTNQSSLEQETDSEFRLLWENSPTRLNPEWIKHFGGDRLEYGDDFVRNLHGNLYVTSTSFTPVYSTGNVDITLFEVDTLSGNVLWNEKWDRTEFDYVSGIAEGKDGKVFLAGSTSAIRSNVAQNYSQENFDILLLSFDPVEKQWITVWSWGETNINEYCNDVTIGDDGHIYLVGTSQSSNNDMIVVKINGTSNVPIWIQLYGGDDIKEGNTLVFGRDGYLYALGTKYSSLTSSQFYIMKIDPASGESLWNMSWGSMSINEGLSLILGSDNSLYVTGASYVDDLDLAVVKLNPNSEEPIWTAVWGTNNRDYGNDLVFFNQNLLVLGTANETGSIGGEVVLLEVNPENGDIQYVSLWGSSHQEIGKKLLTDQPNDGFYLLGTIETSSEARYNSDILIGHFIPLISKKNMFEEAFRIGFSLLTISFCIIIVLRNKPKKIEKL